MRALPDMSESDLPLDLPMLGALLQAADVEAQRTCAPFQASASHALQMELWRMRRPLIAAAGAHADEARAVAQPFARVAELLDQHGDGVLLSLRGASARSDYVQLRPVHFFRAARLVGMPL